MGSAQVLLILNERLFPRIVKNWSEAEDGLRAKPRDVSENKDCKTGSSVVRKTSAAKVVRHKK